MPHTESPVINELVNGSSDLKSEKKLDVDADKATPPIPRPATIGLNRFALPPRPPPLVSLGTSIASDYRLPRLPPRPPLPRLPASKLPFKAAKRPPLVISNSVLGRLPLRHEIRSLPPSRSVTPTDLDLRRLNLSRHLSTSNNSLDGSSRCISPLSTSSITSSIYSHDSPHRQSRSYRSLTPRRIFPQTYSPDTSLDLSELMSLEQSPTVINGRLSFDLGSHKQYIRQDFHADPAHAADAETASRYLTAKINNFLKRTDHITEEWKDLHGSSKRSDVFDMIEDERLSNGSRMGRSRSVTNILIKGFRMAKDMPPTERSHSRSNSVCRTLSNATSQETLIDDFDQVIIDALCVVCCCPSIALDLD